MAQGEVTDLASTWRNTLDTVFELIRRPAFAKPYADIRDAMKSVVTALLEVNKETGEFTGRLTPLATDISNKINKAWDVFRNAVVNTVQFIQREGPRAVQLVTDVVSGVQALWNAIPAPVRDAGILGAILFGLGPQRLLVMSGLAILVKTLEEAGKASQRVADVQAATARGFERPADVAIGSDEQARLAREFLQKDNEARRAMAEARRRDMSADRAEQVRLAALAARPQGPAEMRGGTGLTQEVQDKIERGLEQMRERTMRAREQTFQAELADAEEQGARLLALARNDQRRQVEIRQATADLITAITERHQEKVIEENRRAAQELLDLETSAQAALLDAQGRGAEAQLLQMRREFDRELNEAGAHEARRIAAAQRFQANLTTIAKQTRDEILAIDRDLFSEQQDLANRRLSLEERIADIRIGALERQRTRPDALGFLPDQTALDAIDQRISRIRDNLQRLRDEGFAKQIEALNRMKAAFDQTLDVDKIAQANRELSALSEQRARAQADDLLRQSQEQIQRAERFRQEGRPDLAGVAERQADALAERAQETLRSAIETTTRLSDETTALLNRQREEKLGIFTGIMKQLQDITGAATTEIGKQFTALGNHIQKSFSDAVRGAAAQLEALTGRKIELPPVTPIPAYAPPGAGSQTPVGSVTSPGGPNRATGVPGVPGTSPALSPQGSGFITSADQAVMFQNGQMLTMTADQLARTNANLSQIVQDLRGPQQQALPGLREPGIIDRGGTGPNRFRPDFGPADEVFIPGQRRPGAQFNGPVTITMQFPEGVTREEAVEIARGVIDEEVRQMEASTA